MRLSMQAGGCSRRAARRPQRRAKAQRARSGGGAVALRASAAAPARAREPTDPDLPHSVLDTLFEFPGAHAATHDVACEDHGGACTRSRGLPLPATREGLASRHAAVHSSVSCWPSSTKPAAGCSTTCCDRARQPVVACQPTCSRRASVARESKEQEHQQQACSRQQALPGRYGQMWQAGLAALRAVTRGHWHVQCAGSDSEAHQLGAAVVGYVPCRRRPALQRTCALDVLNECVLPPGLNQGRRSSTDAAAGTAAALWAGKPCRYLFAR